MAEIPKFQNCDSEIPEVSSILEELYALKTQVLVYNNA